MKRSVLLEQVAAWFGAKSRDLRAAVRKSGRCGCSHTYF
jgi:hypothetical protein